MTDFLWALHLPTADLNRSTTSHPSHKHDTCSDTFIYKISSCSCVSTVTNNIWYSTIDNHLSTSHIKCVNNQLALCLRNSALTISACDNHKPRMSRILIQQTSISVIIIVNKTINILNVCPVFHTV